MKSRSVPGVVPARLRDLPSIEKLARRIWPECYRRIVSPAQITHMLDMMYNRETMEREVKDEGVKYWRLMSGDKLIGYMSYGPGRRKCDFTLHKFYIEKAHRGLGYGALMMNTLRRAALRAGRTRIRLRVNRRNSRAIAAYKRYGFVVTTEDVRRIGAGFVMDDYIMEKDLFAKRVHSG